MLIWQKSIDNHGPSASQQFTNNQINCFVSYYIELYIPFIANISLRKKILNYFNYNDQKLILVFFLRIYLL